MIVLETDRLTLRRLTVADAAALHEMETDPEVTRHLGRGPLGEVADYRLHLVNNILGWYQRDGGFGAWAVLAREDGAFLGTAMLRPAVESRDAVGMGYGPGEVEIGYSFRRPVWGHGYATELARALVQHARHMLGVSCLVACVSEANVASIRVLEKAGLVRVPGVYPLPNEAVPCLKFVRAL